MTENNTTLRLLRELQTELRALREELKPIRENHLTRADMYCMTTILIGRFAEFETHMNSRLDKA